MRSSRKRKEMVDNVFGSPITASTLKNIPEYAGKIITRIELALEAVRLKNYHKEARKYVEKLKDQHGGFGSANTLCLIYNATGDPITLVGGRDWEGSLVASPYPVRIENGQWGAFLHRQTSGESGSHGAVVYSGVNEMGKGYCWCVAWSTPSFSYEQSYLNKVYCEAIEVEKYGREEWRRAKDALQKSGPQHRTKPNEDGFYSIISTGCGPIALFEALLTFDPL